MKISSVEAAKLCELVVCSIQSWTAVNAALQSGGLEAKARGRFATALETWVIYFGHRFIVLPEYCGIDFSFINPINPPQGRLSVDTVIEVKFNYLSQAPNEIIRRVLKGIIQAERYKKNVNATDAYVLYLIAFPLIAQIPIAPQDSGWEYWNSKYSNDAQSAISNSCATVIGDHQNNCFYCCLISTTNSGLISMKCLDMLPLK